MHLRLVFASLISALLSGLCHAADAQIAVASNFAVPAQQIIAAFHREPAQSHKITLTGGATRKLYAQIRNGAPFDVLLAADATTPALLERETFAVTGSRFTYATGRLLLWSSRADYVDAHGEVLRRGNFKYLAVASPKLTPYGTASYEVMQALRLDKALQTRIVLGENIAQTHQFVASGNAELGFVAASLVTLDGKLVSGSAWTIPEKLHAPIRQDAVLLLHGQDNPAARAFLDYLKSPTAQAIIKRYGYY